MIDVEFAGSAYAHALLHYSPKEYANGHARAPDRVSATFFSPERGARERGAREVRRSEREMG